MHDPKSPWWNHLGCALGQLTQRRSWRHRLGGALLWLGLVVKQGVGLKIYYEVEDMEADRGR